MKAVADNLKTHTNNYIEPFHFKIEETHDKVEIVEYTEENGNLSISLYSMLFTEDKFRFFFHGNKLVIVVSEMVKTNQAEMPVVDWYRYSNKTYERFINVSIVLPGDNFYILRHFLIPEKFYLKIVLGKAIEN